MDKPKDGVDLEEVQKKDEVGRLKARINELTDDIFHLENKRKTLLDMISSVEERDEVLVKLLSVEDIALSEEDFRLLVSMTKHSLSGGGMVRFMQSWASTLIRDKISSSVSEL